MKTEIAYPLTLNSAKEGEDFATRLAEIYYAIHRQRLGHAPSVESAQCLGIAMRLAMAGETSEGLDAFLATRKN